MATLEMRREYNRRYRAKNMDKVRAWDRAQKTKDREKRLERDRRRYAKNPRYFVEWSNTQYATNENFRLRCILRSRIRKVLKNGRSIKAMPSLKLLGCSVDAFKHYLEQKFLSGMSWHNQGNGVGKWQIDHIRPCASFDLCDPEQQKQCFHYTNLQPLWAKDNREKGSKWPTEA